MSRSGFICQGVLLGGNFLDHLFRAGRPVIVKNCSQLNKMEQDGTGWNKYQAKIRGHKYVLVVFPVQRWVPNPNPPAAMDQRAFASYQHVHESDATCKITTVRKIKQEWTVLGGWSCGHIEYLRTDDHHRQVESIWMHQWRITHAHHWYHLSFCIFSSKHIALKMVKTCEDLGLLLPDKDLLGSWHLTLKQSFWQCLQCCCGIHPKSSKLQTEAAREGISSWISVQLNGPPCRLIQAGWRGLSAHKLSFANHHFIRTYHYTVLI